jgi:hypothetical protein
MFLFLQINYNVPKKSKQSNIDQETITVGRIIIYRFIHATASIVQSQ